MTRETKNKLSFGFCMVCSFTHKLHHLRRECYTWPEQHQTAIVNHKFSSSTLFVLLTWNWLLQFSSLRGGEWGGGGGGLSVGDEQALKSYTFDPTSQHSVWVSNTRWSAHDTERNITSVPIHWISLCACVNRWTFFDRRTACHLICQGWRNREEAEIWIVRLYKLTLGISRFYGVMVSTLDSESSDPSSNLGRTWLNFFFTSTAKSYGATKIKVFELGKSGKSAKVKRSVWTVFFFSLVL